MSVPCDICKAYHCACEGPYCGWCRTKMEEINNDPNLTPEQKQEKILELYNVSS